MRQNIRRHLVRVTLYLCQKGRAKPQAEIRAPTQQLAAAWRRDRTHAGAASGEEEDGVARHPLGFVTNGSFDELRGHAVALGFCAAGDLFSLPVETAGGAVLVAVRNASSRHFRLALASVCCERH
jgi:hypothetical protein